MAGRFVLVIEDQIVDAVRSALREHLLEILDDSRKRGRADGLHIYVGLTLSSGGLRRPPAVKLFHEVM